MIEAKTLAHARHLVEETISARRCSHVFAVAEEMGKLCTFFGLEEVEGELLLSALLHDITKEKSAAAQLQLCDEYGIILSAEDREVKKALHALTGAEFARREFGLPEEFVLAVRYHTTGRADMTLYEKLLFLADYIEKTRTYPACKTVRRVFLKKMRQAKSASERSAALDDAVLLGLDLTLRDLVADGAFIHPDTVAARNSLLKQKQAKA